jgi:23S rRNA (uracil1939-C5)-methyltransferase
MNPAQLRIKEGIFRDIFAAASLTDLPEIEVHSGPEWNYRNRIRLRVGEVDGGLRVGYNRHRASGGDVVLPITMCPIAAPILWQTASALLDIAKDDPAVRAWLAAAIELELFTNAEESALQLTLFTRRWEHPKAGPQWGTPGLAYRVGETNLWVGRGAFFQVNRYLVSTLARLATSGRTGTLAWDLYAGVGLFSRSLSGRFERVVAVEAAEPASKNLKAALASAPGGKNHHAIAATTLDFLKTAIVQRERPDLIVMDPPRSGVGPEVCTLLGRIRAPELVYVSCDPVTLARDLNLLIIYGYEITQLHLVDMFPQTFHMETVAVLRR